MIEHVPDLIGWLGELHDVLSSEGEVRLIVPDKRFTFDHLRTTTPIDSVLYCHLIKARIPQPHLAIDYCMNVAKIDPVAAWTGQLNPNELVLHHDAELAMRVARDIIDNNSYHDIHCWVFTPASFAVLFRKMAELNLINFACIGFHDTLTNDIEFFVNIKQSNNKEEILESWKDMEIAAVSNRPFRNRARET